MSRTNLTREIVKYDENSIKGRLMITMNNIDTEMQKGYAMWDDIDKLEHVVALLKLGRRLDDEFDFVPNLKVKWKIGKKTI